MTQEIEKAIVDASQIYPATYQKPYLDGGIFGYKLAIEKACEWLERNYHATPMGGYYYLPEDCIELFRKAMKGG